MEQEADTPSMEIVVLLFIILIGLLAVAFGADSQLDERVPPPFPQHGLSDPFDR